MAEPTQSPIPFPGGGSGGISNPITTAVTVATGGSISTTGTGTISATPGGSTNQIQYNNAGVLGGVASFSAITGGTGGVQLTGGTVAPLFLVGGVPLFINDGSGPAGIAGYSGFWSDVTTHTFSYNANNNGTTSFSGAWVNTNVTPVTVNANSAAAQNLMSASVPAGTLNRVGRSLRIWAAGVYTLPASAGTTTTIAVTLGGVTLLTITDTSLTTGVTNGQFLFTGMATTQTGGATGVLEVHGQLGIELGATGAVADSYFLDTNTAVSSAVNLTAAQTLQVTVTFNVASASNTATQRQMVLETVG